MTAIFATPLKNCRKPHRSFYKGKFPLSWPIRTVLGTSRTLDVSIKGGCLNSRGGGHGNPASFYIGGLLPNSESVAGVNSRKASLQRFAFYSSIFWGVFFPAGVWYHLRLLYLPQSFPRVPPPSSPCQWAQSGIPLVFLPFFVSDLWTNSDRVSPDMPLWFKNAKTFVIKYINVRFWIENRK